MAPYKNPLDALIKRAHEKDAAVRGRPVVAHPSSDAPMRLGKLVADLFPGDEPLATPAPRRHTPERDAASAGRRGAGAGQHLYAVEAKVVQIGYGREIRARRRRGLSSQRPAGGSAA